MYKLVLFVLITIFLNDISSQYQHLKPKQTCENSQTSMIERFFNLVFTEFQTNAPVCVCVQMCVGQSTYCYPNGCLKREEHLRKATVSNVPYNNSKQKPFIVVTEEQNDYIADLINKNYIDESKIVKAEKSIYNNLVTDPFSDKFKYVFQHKKVPKVQIKYNLREQIRNMKSDVLRMENNHATNGRWPIKKITKIKENKIYSNIHAPPLNINNKLFLAPKNERADTAKYFKRDTNEVNIKAIYIVENIKENESTKFSLESLIDNIIEDTLTLNKSDHKLKSTNDSKNYTQIVSDKKEMIERNPGRDLNITNNALLNKKIYKLDEKKLQNSSINKEIVNQMNKIKVNTAIEDINNFMDNNINEYNLKYILTKSVLDNETKIISMDNTYENLKKNVYVDDKDNITVLSDVIKSLSKEIEKQNNTSLEMLKILGDVKNHDINGTDALKATPNIENTTISNTLSIKDNKIGTMSPNPLNKRVNIVTEMLNTTPKSYDFKITKKYKHRLRRIHNRKI